MEDMHRAKMYIPYELLIRILHLPEGTEILYLENTPEDVVRQKVALHVSHPDLPITPDGATPINVGRPRSRWDWK